MNDRKPLSRDVVRRRLLLGSVLAVGVVAAAAGSISTCARTPKRCCAPSPPAVASHDAADAACGNALEEVTRALAAVDGTVNEATIRRIQDLARASADLTSDAGERCKKRLLLEASRAPTCGIALSAVFSSIVVSPLTLPRELGEAVQRATPACQAVMIRTFPFLVDADMSLVRVLEGIAQHATSTEHRMTAWEGLGTLCYRARKKGRADVVTQVEALLRAKLVGLHASEERVPLLEAAGNAGCLACLPLVESAASDKATEIRAAAVGALRFVASGGAVTRMCEATTSDDDAAVRQAGAWALRNDTSFELERITCLAKAAAQDPSKVVRSAALGSLGVLAASLERARSALIFLTDETHSEETRRRARAELAGHVDALMADAGHD